MGGSTRTVGIIGWPVAHSLSPAIHNAAFAAMGLDWVYVPLPVHPLHLAAALGGIASMGFVGANVTMPHKAAVAGLVDDLSDDARRLHAVNTIVCDGERLRGANTDAPGFERFLRMDAGFDPSGRDALIFGAGGAGRACALALAREGRVFDHGRRPGAGSRGGRRGRARRRANRSSTRWGSIAR